MRTQESSKTTRKGWVRGRKSASTTGSKSPSPQPQRTQDSPRSQSVLISREDSIGLDDGVSLRAFRVNNIFKSRARTTFRALPLPTPANVLSVRPARTSFKRSDLCQRLHCAIPVRTFGWPRNRLRRVQAGLCQEDTPRGRKSLPRPQAKPGSEDARVLPWQEARARVHNRRGRKTTLETGGSTSVNVLTVLFTGGPEKCRIKREGDTCLAKRAILSGL